MEKITTEHGVAVHLSGDEAIREILKLANEAMQRLSAIFVSIPDRNQAIGLFEISVDTVITAIDMMFGDILKIENGEFTIKEELMGNFIESLDEKEKLSALHAKGELPLTPIPDGMSLSQVATIEEAKRREALTEEGALNVTRRKSDIIH